MDTLKEQPQSKIGMSAATQIPIGAIGFALVYPTILTLVYFQWLQSATAGIQQSVYAIGKLIQFSFPVLFVLFASSRNGTNAWPRVGDHEELSNQSAGSVLTQDTARNSFLLGLAFGLTLVVVMFTIYFFILPTNVAERLVTMAQNKVNAMGVETPAKFLALSLFYVIGHSFLEEYYWRWFVFNGLQQCLAIWKANLIAAIGFMAHHVVLLGFFFGWNSPFTYLLSASVAVGGIFWAWLFNRQMGFRSSWFSHAIVDAGIFGLGMIILNK
jgi:membrane protease YdiL (CAAX protease family)